MTTLSDLSFDKSFSNKLEAKEYASKQKEKYNYVRVIKSIVSSNVYNKVKLTFYRVYVGF